MAMTCHAHMAAALMLRCWEPLQHWPFRGTKVTRAFPEETREAISEEWKRSCEFCLDGFSKSFKIAAFECEEPEGVLEGDILESLEHAYGALPVNNLQTEDPHCTTIESLSLSVGWGGSVRKGHCVWWLWWNWISGLHCIHPILPGPLQSSAACGQDLQRCESIAQHSLLRPCPLRVQAVAQCNTIWVDKKMDVIVIAIRCKPHCRFIDHQLSIASLH